MEEKESGPIYIRSQNTELIKNESQKRRCTIACRLFYKDICKILTQGNSKRLDSATSLVKFI